MMGRLCAAALCMLSLCAKVCAQTPDTPGPMQSGPHAADLAEKGRSAAAQPNGTPAASFDVNQLFATTCGWCHFKGGREAGKGPKLEGTQLTDTEIVTRIRNGKPGQMPAFGSTFNDEQLQAIIAYIRSLKP